MSKQALVSKTLNSLKWSYVNSGSSAVLQVVFTTIMARLLSPEDFGVVAMANVALGLVGYFSRMGVSQALVQKPAISKGEIRAGFTSSFLLGIFFYGFVFLLAPLAGAYYHNSEVIPLLRILGIGFVISGFSLTANGLLRRELLFKTLAIAELCAFTFGYVLVGVALAFLGAGAWSLVGASLTQLFIVAVVYYLNVRHSIVPSIKWRDYKDLLGFGSQVSLVSFLEFLGFNSDSIMIGRFFGAGALGIYRRAYMLIFLPSYQFSNSFANVLFSTFSRLQGEKNSLRVTYQTAVSVSAGVLIPLCFGAAAAAHEIVFVLLGQQWAEAVPLLRILAIAAPASVLTQFAGTLCESQGVLKPKIILQTIYVIVLAVLLLFLGNFFGLVGAASALAVATILRYIAYVMLVKNLVSSKASEVWQTHLPALTTGLVVALVLQLISYIFQLLSTPILGVLLIEISVGALILGVSSVFGPLRFVTSNVIAKLKQHTSVAVRFRLIGKIESLLRIQGIKG